MTPIEYLRIEAEQLEIIKNAEMTIQEARKSADRTPTPNKEELRPCLAEDIRPGAIVWHDNGDWGWFWNVVDEPMHYGDPWKAYMSDGARYGLKDACVYKDFEKSC